MRWRVGGRRAEERLDVDHIIIFEYHSDRLPPSLGLEQVGKMLGRILVRPALRDRKAIDLTYMLLEAATDVERASTLCRASLASARRSRASAGLTSG